MTWLLQQVEALAGQAVPDPAQSSQQALAFSKFLEHCPADFLEPLLSSPFGRVYRLFLERCCTAELPGVEAATRRDHLSQQLRACGFQTPAGHALLLALMPFYAPLKLRVDDAAAKLPAWLLELYQRRYEPAIAPATTPSGQPSFDDRIFLNRMLGLSNLYYIDPEDQEILEELRQVRLATVQLLLGCEREELGRHFCADFGDRYWAMAQSGVQKEPLNPQESQQRDAVQAWLSSTPNSLHQEGGIQRFAAVLLFSNPGTVRLNEPERNLPAWFLEGFKRYSSMAVTA